MISSTSSSAFSTSMILIATDCPVRLSTLSHVSIRDIRSPPLIVPFVDLAEAATSYIWSAMFCAASRAYYWAYRCTFASYTMSPDLCVHHSCPMCPPSRVVCALVDLCLPCTLSQCCLKGALVIPNSPASCPSYACSPYMFKLQKRGRGRVRGRGGETRKRLSFVLARMAVPVLILLRCECLVSNTPRQSSRDCR